MFCPTCGQQAHDNAKFCSNCGTAFVNDTSSSPIGTPPTDDTVIDLRGQTDANAPSEKKHIPTVIAGLLLIIIWVLQVFVASKFAHASTPLTDSVLFAMAICSLPLAVIGLPLVLLARKKADLPRKTKKSESVLFYIFTWLTPALGLTWSFMDTFSDMGLGKIIVAGWFFMMLLLFFFMCNAFADQNGKEGMFSILTGAFSGFIAAVPLAYAFGLLIAAMELAIVIVFAATILFFVLGGRIIFVRKI